MAFFPFYGNTASAFASVMAMVVDPGFSQYLTSPAFFVVAVIIESVFVMECTYSVSALMC